MPVKGQIITNPISGDKFEFLETAADTNKERVTLKATVRSKGQLVPKHYHVLQDETYEVLSGQLTIILRNEKMVLKAGQEMALPKNIPHNHFNEKDEIVTYIQTVTPALDFEYLIENLVGLAADGRSRNGKYGLIQELVTLKYLESKTYLADIPLGMQKILMNIVAPVGRLLGYRAIYKKYSGFEK